MKRAKKPITPSSIIRNALRRLWLHSRERHAALKRDGYTCVDCHRKQSKARGKEFRVEVDHLDGIDMQHLINEIRRCLLVSHDRLETVCRDDHARRTDQRQKFIEKGYF